QTATVVVNPGPASTIAANSPTSQTAAAGTAVSSPPSVIVKDANGNPVAGVSVTFSPTVGSGTVTGGSQMTNASGVATVGSWTLSATAGSNTLTATSGSLSGSPVTFTATGTAGPSATMAKSSGDNLTGQVATRLQTPHVVLVSDANGNPVAGVTVAWAAGSGGGSVDPATSTTDANGHAQTFRTLGILIGTQTTTATATVAGKDTTVTFSITATGAGSPVPFSATATAGTATQLTISTQPSATAQSGAAFDQQPVLQLRDASGNPVSQAGVTVTAVVATGPTGATVTNAAATTTGSGAATFNGLAISGPVGNYTLRFGSGSLSAPTSGTIALSAGAAATIAANSATSQSATAGTAVNAPPPVIGKDANGNPVMGVAVTIAVTQGNGSITGESQTTNSGGVAK